MKKPLLSLLVITVLSVLLTACTATPWSMSHGISPSATVTPHATSPQPARIAPIVIPYRMDRGQKLVPIDTMVKKIGFSYVDFDPMTGVLKAGDTDVVLRLKSGSRHAEKSGGTVVLSASPKTIDGHLYVPATTIADLLQEEIVYELDATGLRIMPTDASLNKDKSLDDALHFEEETAPTFYGGTPEMTSTPVVATIKDIDIDALIGLSQTYKGVPYLFGAKPYAQSKRFDCSSFTKHVFAKYGIVLPRLAREQATVGATVSRKRLQKGDLLFFYVPGRFKSNNIVGHVGIYIGDMKMIDANRSPKNGVQIRMINTPYWERTFLKAKRVAI